ncbi:MAG: FAD-dependent oxidoreductase [Lachnospiraceae bacterium]|nr:FAD-dependent oxidoreductase [Lachnospiraceae bacterium]
MFDQLFSPLTIRGKTLKNRLVVPAMLTYYCDTNGNATEKYIRYHEEKAKGGFGLIITEDYSVDEKGISFATVPGLWCDEQIESHKKLAERVHQHGALIFVQLFHSGMQGDEAILGQAPKAPSAIMSPFGDALPVPFTTEEVKDMVRKFGDAAFRAKKAGFDGVELHGAHGYLIDQFLSPFMNKRLDEYGGNLWNRTRFPREIIEDIRRKCGSDFIIDMRISADEFVEGGLNVEDAKAISRILEEAGADMFDVSLANYSSLEFCMASSHMGHGWFSDYAEAIKDAVNVPVMAVNRINDPFIAEGILRDGRADFIAMGRQSLCDPHFPEKAREGRIEDIRTCLGCNVGCVNVLWTASPIRCVLNPELGHEGPESEILPAETKKNVAVIGAGPAGLYAAIAAARRGHKVTVYEASDHAGGSFFAASFPPCKGEITQFLVWQLTQCEKLGVEIRYNTKISAGDLKGLGADHIILATGARPATAPIKGLKECGIACFAADVLEGKIIPGNQCVVIGGGEVGAETAHFLALELKKVTLLEMLPDIAREAATAVKVPLVKELKARDVRVLTSVAVKEVKEASVVFDHPDGHTEEIPADMIVVATGYRSDNILEESIREAGIPYTAVGDAVKARNALEANTEGYYAGRAI